MKEILIKQLARTLSLSVKQVSATLMLLDGGATIPFIARYRKEVTGSLNEVQIASIRDGMQALEALEKRRAYIIEHITSQNKLTDSLRKKLLSADSMSLLEDLYLPYKPKRKTRASVAREKGLTPLARWLMQQRNGNVTIKASTFINKEKDVPDVTTALAGARDIIAEEIAENALVRQQLRRLFASKARVIVRAGKKADEDEMAKYHDYFEYNEIVQRIPSHRFLAIQRGVKEGFLRWRIAPDEEMALEIIDDIMYKADNEAWEQVEQSITDSYKRLLQPSLETALRNTLKLQADNTAIEVFSSNLRELLMAAPLGQKNVLAVDPGFRTGCKVVCLNKQGTLLSYDTIYPHHRNPMQRYAAINCIEALCEKYAVEYVAIGNGTAGRETVQFFKGLHLENIPIVMVNESGASVYSASAAARAEFPDHDITVRGAVSIGRRLLDPLAELVKIDPKAIGVGQYQHDVDQTKLRQSLDDVVMSCVNKVGVSVNTASKELLTYVSGLGAKLAQNIIDYRKTNGGFTTKSDLKKVKGIGLKAFEQAAGFIRIANAQNPLDASAVHPERYTIVEKMATDLQTNVQMLVQDAALREQIDLRNYTNTEVGMPTLTDIMQELAKPGRDPREQFELVEFKEDIKTIEDLSEGMVLNGIITNVTNFGAFVDIGVHQDGLVHISQLANVFVRDPKQIVKVRQKVKVKVIALDVKRKRINLSMKDV